MFLGEQVRTMREAAKLSQEGLAQLAEVSTWTIHRIETNKTRKHRHDTMKKVAVALGKDACFFDIWLFPGPLRVRKAA